MAKRGTDFLDEWFGVRRKRFSMSEASQSKVRWPATPVSGWQKTYAKARRVKGSNGGSGKQAVKSHVRYLLHTDGHEHKDRLVAEIGDIHNLRSSWSSEQQHYRVIIAPQRGDVLDMMRLAKNACSEVMERFGVFKYAGAIHEKLQSNGRLNKHIHLIFSANFDVGAVALKNAFATAAAREATLQFEEKGLVYKPDLLEVLDNVETKHLDNELMMGNHAS